VKRIAVVGDGGAWEHRHMSNNEQRDTELGLGPYDRAELDRRWAEHLAEPKSAIPWSVVRRQLRDD
jgi:putative addiction module component (TIGR02574 family)